MSFIWNELLYEPLLKLLVFFYNVIPGNDLGIAIILLTILVRLLMLPSSIKASRSQRKMQVLMPELNKMKEQHKGDQQAVAKAQMDFYKQHKISPFSSCLPLLVQLPIIFALFGVFRAGLGEIDPSKIYSFIKLPEILDTTFLGLIDLASPDKFVLPILAGASQFILSRITTSTSSSPGPEQAITRQMTLILPVMTVFFAMSFPAGLALYWVVSTLFGIGQQVYVNREKEKEVIIRVKNEEGGEGKNKEGA